jgi:hypothetical protein
MTMEGYLNGSCADCNLVGEICSKRVKSSKLSSSINHLIYSFK